MNSPPFLSKADANVLTFLTYKQILKIFFCIILHRIIIYFYVSDIYILQLSKYT